jgi:hypothetical protein
MAAITRTGDSNFVIDGSTLGTLSSSDDDVIVLTNCSNFTIRNVVIGNSFGVGIKMDTCTGTNVIEQCQFPGLMNGNIFGIDCDMTISVRDNVGGTVARAGHKDGSRGQFLQIVFSALHGSVIEYNYSVQGVGSDKEDTISLNGSSGDNGNPTIVRNNWIRGRGPSTTGAGIAVGENGGSYVRVEDNTIIDAGVVAFFCAGGTGHLQQNNRAYASAASSGHSTFQAAHYIDDYDLVGGCTLNTIINNTIDWYGNVDTWFDPGSCTATTHTAIYSVDLSFLLTATPTAPRVNGGGGGGGGGGTGGGTPGGSRNANGDVYINWDPRSRMSSGFALGTTPADEEFEVYDVEVWDASRTVLLHTYESISASEITIFASDQVAFFGGPVNAINISVYKLSPLVGRGYEARGVM